jgi:hypothetical protein
MMLPRSLTFSMIVTVLLSASVIQQAKAGFGVESKQPPAGACEAQVDERAVGAWRATIQDKIYFLHVGVGNISPQSHWMELVLLNQGEPGKRSFYVHHKLGFSTTIGSSRVFSIANTSKTLEQLRYSGLKELLEAVGSYDIYKYDVTEDYLDVWAANQDFIRESIQAGKIKGNGAAIQDTSDNLLRFIESTGPKLFPKPIRFVRVK